MQYDLLKTPIGQLPLAADADGLHHIRFDRADRDAVIEPHWQRGGEWLEPVLAQLRAYFDGELQHFNLPLAASRAVGAANGANPLPIVVPCHRVIGASGTLTGFGGGLPVKQWLLEHERKQRSLWA